MIDASQLLSVFGAGASAATSAAWWKAWAVPESVDAEIQDSFSSEQLPSKQLSLATKALLRWRFEQIPNPKKRDEASYLLERAILFGTFHGEKFTTRTDCEEFIERIFSPIPEDIRKICRGRQKVFRWELVDPTFLELGFLFEIISPPSHCFRLCSS